MEADNDDGVFGDLPRLECGFDINLIVENAHGRFDHMARRVHRRDLDNPLPKIARQLCQPARFLERVRQGPQDLVIQRFACAIFPDQRAVAQFGFLRIAFQPVARDGANIIMQQPRIQQIRQS